VQRTDNQSGTSLLAWKQAIVQQDACIAVNPATAQNWVKVKCDGWRQASKDIGSSMQPSQEFSAN
jgi:hypothetical protein